MTSDNRAQAEQLIRPIVGKPKYRGEVYQPEDKSIARAQVHAILALAAAVDRVADALLKAAGQQ
ncbi:hypothetical protein Caci_2935 [Catenulispora acidiphila DSM 44928]|uniref:Uncharacterized protein n=1 Tax=Catenulispora acidiphila (strain DSM 44928 / JCM 14897 / NBRC 102108 / NRRL B-24433 / ID139908) TaxID=479433 RepID=C7Q2V2_CATAD|nr:hypothetical protein [Catenulispora acidiphila]ACU71844.1 hypothetical protein Caci_2935 [Catenulispora acidiphila DSM 44928]